MPATTLSTAFPVPRPTAPVSLLALDPENLAGGASATRDVCRASLLAVARAVTPQPGDFVYLAANTKMLATAAFDSPFSGQVIPAFRGPDGAERALLERIPVDWVVRRFERVVIGSGDHAFGDLARAARAAGLEVVVIGRKRSIHHSFWRLGCTVLHLEDFLSESAPLTPGTPGRVIPFPTSPGPEDPPAVGTVAA